MSFQERIAALIPEGPGEVLWLGPRHAQALINGLPISQRPKKAIVLSSLLGLFQDPVLVLRRLADHVADGGVLIAAGPARLNPRVRKGTTRRELFKLVDAAGYDLVFGGFVADPTAPWRPSMPRRGPQGKTIDELEEAGAEAVFVAARIADADAPECSIVIASAGSPGLGETSLAAVELVSVESKAGETRAATWNRGARTATGRYLAFVDARSQLESGWLDALLQAVKDKPGIGMAGLEAVGFGPLVAPCSSLPYRLGDDPGGEVPAVSGAALVLPRRLFAEAGGLDEELGASLDVPDLCMRLRARDKRSAARPEAKGKGSADDDWTGVRRFLFRWRGQIADEPRFKPVSPRPSTSSPAPILWSGPILQQSGYGEEARSFVLGLDQIGIDVRANPTEWDLQTRLRQRDASRLAELTLTEAPDRFINVVHSFPAARMLIGGAERTFPLVEHFVPHPRAVRNIGRTMYESDRIPPPWVESCNRMDEVWVPSEFNITTFAGSGVAREKLFRIPGGIDTQLFRPDSPPAPVDGARGFVFLSVFAWSLRKGWDALVRAFLEEFDAADDVTLILKALPLWNSNRQKQTDDLRDYIESVLGRKPQAGPPILVDMRDLDQSALPPLYAAADAFVLASRGEAYGRPFLEAMAMGMPVIGTRCGGNVDFMNERNSYLVDTEMVDVPEAGVREIPDFAGHRWAEPDVGGLRAAMRRVFEEREEGRQKGMLARADVVEHHSWASVARAVVERLQAGGVEAARSSRPKTVAVTWEGPHSITFGMAEVNREMAGVLREEPGIELKASADADLRPWLTGRPPDVTVRHAWPPNFDPPETGRLVIFQPWEYGSLPSAWIEPLNRLADEVWVPSEYVRDGFMRSGVDAGKLTIVPYGIDPARYRPGVTPLELPTAKKTRFLFVGGTIARKGVDHLLAAYTATFRREDDVCLVIKELGAATFYRGQGVGEQIHALMADPAAPEIVYLTEDMNSDDMPRLYSACQCLVHPYRGEGFGLPIAEAMACGLAVIVPRHGAALDFCDDTVAYLVPAREVPRAEARVGNLATVGPGWWAEVDRAELGAAMRRVFEHPDEARALGAHASERIRRDVTWHRAGRIAAARIQALAARPARVTVCVITRDEEQSLPRCLDSLRGLADEVVVLDTGSSDRTVEAARESGARVVSAPWTDDLSAARNAALQLATGAWVLVLDADEWLDERGRAEVRRIVDDDLRAPQRVRQITGERERSLVRLFPNRPGLRFAGRTGERVVAGSTPVAGAPAGVVVHHDATASSRRRRAERLLPLREQAARDSQDDPGIALELAGAYVEAERREQARDEASRALGLLRWRPEDDRDAALLRREAAGLQAATEPVRDPDPNRTSSRTS